MKKLINNLPMILPVLVIAGVLVYSFWIRELPKAEGRITGDYAEATELAADESLPVLLAVDVSPH